MKKKTDIPKDNDSKAKEPEATYQTTPTVDKWNPNKPFHGTQEEWWEHFCEIEKGEFTPVEEAHQRVKEWLQKQNR